MRFNVVVVFCHCCKSHFYPLVYFLYLLYHKVVESRDVIRLIDVTSISLILSAFCHQFSVRRTKVKIDQNIAIINIILLTISQKVIYPMKWQHGILKKFIPLQCIPVILSIHSILGINCSFMTTGGCYWLLSCHAFLPPQICYYLLSG